ncbi:hypothetical protein L3X38_042173 [Prunus dulcis]|uniref:Uncharacterized protein n=1 Tax=Prunus dulcis TaxID=3755 RepID=A0AAD4YLB8_PRUDU|nr:hypothetical protein L3X38_042173 [Prunus dulcis]
MDDGFNPMVLNTLINCSTDEVPFSIPSGLTTRANANDGTRVQVALKGEISSSHKLGLLTNVAGDVKTLVAPDKIVSSRNMRPQSCFDVNRGNPVGTLQHMNKLFDGGLGRCVVVNACDVSGVSYGNFRLCLGEGSYKVVKVLISERRVRWGNGNAQKASPLAPQNGLD